MEKPNIKPNCPNFSSGPCTKPPGWNLDKLKNATLGRSHRSKVGNKNVEIRIIKNRKKY